MSLVVHTDCRYYRGSMPCSFHKQDGRLCEGCRDYDPIKTRVLVIKLAAIGDVLRTTSILPALRKKYEGSEITWVTKRNAAQLLAQNHLIDRLLETEGNYLEFVRNERFDVGICLDADPLSAAIHSLADCSERYGFLADRNGRVQPANDFAREWWLMGLNDQLKKDNRKSYQQIMYEICDLPSAPSRPILHLDDESLQFAQEFAARNRINGSSKIAGVNTGGGNRWQHKKWTLDGYVQLINALRHAGVQVILFGGPEEIEFNSEIKKRITDDIADAGCHNSLRKFAALINLVDVLFTPDSLGMHIGVALGKPVVVSVGPTSPWELDVYGKGEVIHSDIECLACYLTRCDKAVNCMNTLEPQFVLEKIMKYL